MEYYFKREFLIKEKVPCHKQFIIMIYLKKDVGGSIK
jgi:hypothetical protein